MRKRFLPRRNLVVGMTGGVICLMIGLFFMWGDRDAEDHGTRALVIAAVFAALFIGSGVVGEWVGRRRRQRLPEGFEVMRNEAKETPGDPGRR